MQNAYHIMKKTTNKVLHLTVESRDKDVIQEEPEVLRPQEEGDEEEEEFFDVQAPDEDYS